LARRHPNGESEGIWDGAIPIMRPDLRRDMAGIPKISGPQETEKCGTHHPEGTSSPRGGGGESTVPSGEPSFRDESELRERDHSSACKEDSPRERGP
jgi:hypothetical protein